MREAARRLLRRLRRVDPPRLEWVHEVDDGGPSTLSVCHPDWRGVRAATHGFGGTIAETDDAGAHSDTIVAYALAHGLRTLVVQAFPSGADTLIAAAKRAGLSTRAVIHSSPAQHGAERWEAAAVDRFVALARDGSLDRIGFVKAGIADVFTRLGVDAHHIPNRAPRLDPIERVSLGDGLHIGVFAAPFWRKNVVTQLAAVSLLDGAVAHVMSRPDVDYLAALEVVEHGELPRDRFVALQASVDLNLYVTLSECHPISPMESYMSGVPCLISRTSDLFRNDRDLWDLVSVSQADDPVAIADGARRLLDAGSEVIERARAWIRDADIEAARRWEEFLAPR